MRLRSRKAVLKVLSRDQRYRSGVPYSREVGCRAQKSTHHAQARSRQIETVAARKTDSGSIDLSMRRPCSPYLPLPRGYLLTFFFPPPFSRDRCYFPRDRLSSVLYCLSSSLLLSFSSSVRSITSARAHGSSLSLSLFLLSLFLFVFAANKPPSADIKARITRRSRR